MRLNFTLIPLLVLVLCTFGAFKQSNFLPIQKTSAIFICRNIKKQVVGLTTLDGAFKCVRANGSRLQMVASFHTELDLLWDPFAVKPAAIKQDFTQENFSLSLSWEISSTLPGYASNGVILALSRHVTCVTQTTALYS